MKHDFLYSNLSEPIITLPLPRPSVKLSTFNFGNLLIKLLAKEPRTGFFFSNLDKTFFLFYEFNNFISLLNTMRMVLLWKSIRTMQINLQENISITHLLDLSLFIEQTSMNTGLMLKILSVHFFFWREI